MKTDRILEIIIYLINHDNVPASYLAERFHVSVRTIQRDVVTISYIGIPVYSSGGRYGGYSILPTYKMKNIDIRNDEQQMIKKALESLSTSYKSDTLNSITEKYNAIIEREGGQKIFWDFSVTRENDQVQDMNGVLEKAISQRHYILFHYRNADGKESDPLVEPLAIHYKWYAWYLFAFDAAKKEYRTFKVARIQDIIVQSRTFTTEHGDIKQRMDESEQAYYKTCINIEVHFYECQISLIQEYFPDCPVEKISEDIYRIFINVPAKERLWKALLLSFGNRVKVVSPQEYVNELTDTAAKFLSNYDK